MIEFQNVSKTYPNGTKALQNVNLKVDDGEFVFIVGSSGAGKSTFLKTILCEVPIDHGEIIVNQKRLSRIKKRQIPYLRRSMGIVFQNFRLIPNMSVYENVAFAMHVVGATERVIRKRVPYVLGMVGLQDKFKCKPSELSGGEQQRVGLARALVNNPKMIIADEPTGNIDPELSFEIVDLLTEINKRGTTVLMVTHEHNLVKHFRKRIVEIEGGRVVADTKMLTQAEPNLEQIEGYARSDTFEETVEQFQSYRYEGEEEIEPEMPEEASDFEASAIENDFPPITGQGEIFSHSADEPIEPRSFPQNPQGGAQ